MKHDWYSGSAGGLSALWLSGLVQVALMKPSFAPDLDLQKAWADVSAQEITGPGYTAGGKSLLNPVANYDAATGRTDLLADDSTWGPGAVFSVAFAVIYANTGAKPLWSLVNFEGTKQVDGVFEIDWSEVAPVLYLVPA